MDLPPEFCCKVLKTFIIIFKIRQSVLLQEEKTNLDSFKENLPNFSEAPTVLHVLCLF